MSIRGHLEVSRLLFGVYNLPLVLGSAYEKCSLLPLICWVNFQYLLRENDSTFNTGKFSKRIPLEEYVCREFKCVLNYCLSSPENCDIAYVLSLSCMS